MIKPISEIKGTLSNLEEIPIQGGYLPGFEIVCKFSLAYSAATELLMSESAINGQQSTLYRSGSSTPISGQYELINPNGEGTGLEVTSTRRQSLSSN